MEGGNGNRAHGQQLKDNSRKLAADARRLLEDSEGQDSRRVTSRARELLRRNYDRGLEAGRAAASAELGAADPRATLLSVAADTLDNCRTLTDGIPNSGRATSAYEEARAIIEDAIIAEATGGATSG
jgi:hypothetical protein